MTWRNAAIDAVDCASGVAHPDKVGWPGAIVVLGILAFVGFIFWLGLRE